MGGLGEKRGNDTEPKVERAMDPKSKAEIGADHFGTHGKPSMHHEQLQKQGNLDSGPKKK